jgi:hypothetical protein
MGDAVSQRRGAGDAGGVRNCAMSSRTVHWRGSADGAMRGVKRNAWSFRRCLQLIRVFRVSEVSRALLASTEKGCALTANSDDVNSRIWQSVRRVSGLHGAKFMRSRSSVPRIMVMRMRRRRARAFG